MNFSKCLLIDRSRESYDLCNGQGLGHRRSGMLKSYFDEHILLTFLKYGFFFKKWICVVKSNYLKITPLPTSVCFMSQNNRE